MIEQLVSDNIPFLSGFLLGSMLAWGLSFIFYKAKMKQISADAETRGIESGAALEAEIGWRKEIKTSSKKGRKSSSKASRKRRRSS